MSGFGNKNVRNKTFEEVNFSLKYIPNLNHAKGQI